MKCVQYAHIQMLKNHLEVCTLVDVVANLPEPVEYLSLRWRFNGTWTPANGSAKFSEMTGPTNGREATPDLQGLTPEGIRRLLHALS
jgi:hypothetical protein